MPSFHRSGLLGFLLLLAALAPHAAQASSSPSAPEVIGPLSAEASPAASSLEARLQRIAAAVRAQQQGPEPSDQAPLTRAGQGDKLAWVWGNGGGRGWGNGGGWRNGGWRNGGFGNGWRNGGWGNGFRNGGGVVVRW